MLAPPSGPALFSGDSPIGGYTHTSVTAAPKVFSNPGRCATHWLLYVLTKNIAYNTTLGLDYAGNNPANIVRLGYTDDGQARQVALSFDSGATWYVCSYISFPTPSETQSGLSIRMPIKAIGSRSNARSLSQLTVRPYSGHGQMEVAMNRTNKTSSGCLMAALVSERS